MDDLELLRELRADLPEPDARQLRPARRALLKTIADSQRRGHTLRRVRRFLSPSPRRLALSITALVFLLSGGAVAADRIFGPLHDVTFKPNANDVTCLNVVGKPGPEAATLLEERGFEVSWRFTRWGDRVLPADTPSEPKAVTGGFDRTVQQPPQGSVVYDALPLNDGSYVVFVHDPDDPNAPQTEERQCIDSE